MTSHRLPSALMVLIIGALCFSVGEGLRLTPFPVSELLQVEESNVLSTAKFDGDASLSKYGPLDVPSKAQKRNKRQTTDFAFQPLAASRQPVALTWHYLEDNSVELRSSLFASPPAGRAPPLLS